MLSWVVLHYTPFMSNPNHELWLVYVCLDIVHVYMYVLGIYALNQNLNYLYQFWLHAHLCNACNKEHAVCIMYTIHHCSFAAR